MRTGWMAFCVVVLLATLLPTAAVGQAGAPPEVPIALDVLITDDGFEPAGAAVVMGQPVRFLNESTATHTVTHADALFDSGPIPVGGSFTLVVPAHGTHRFTSAAGPETHAGHIAVGHAGLPGPPGDLAGDHVPLSPAPPATALDVEPTWGVGASRTRMLIAIADGATVAQVDDAVTTAGAIIVGGHPSTATLTLELPDPGHGDFSPLAAALAGLRGHPAIHAAAMDLEIVPSSVPRPAGLLGDLSDTERRWEWNRLWNGTEASGSGGNRGLEASRFPQAWNLLDAIRRRDADVQTVVYDSGFDTTHPDLTGLTYFQPCWDIGPFVECWHNADTPARQAHGTHVAGIVGADFDDRGRDDDHSYGLSGANPVAELFGSRWSSVRDGSVGSGLDGIQGILDEAVPGGRLPHLRVINYSGGPSFARDSAGDVVWATTFRDRTCGPGRSDDATGSHACTPNNEDAWLAEMAQLGAVGERIARRASRQGVIIVQATGNNGLDFCVPFGDDDCMAKRILGPNVSEFLWASRDWTGPEANPIIGVESTLIADGFGHYVAIDSNYGGDVTAPGDDIMSTVPTGISDPSVCVGGTSPCWASFSGTSMAAPQVTGLIGYLLAFEPDLTIPEIRSLLTARSTWTVPTTTAPRVDAFASLMAIPDAAAAMVDVNDPSRDGSRRVKYDDDGSVLSADPIESRTGEHRSEPDGRIDMRDLRRFRDAWLRGCQLIGGADCPTAEQVSLDGSADNPKLDLNHDGCAEIPGAANCPIPELVGSRFDFNGDGTVDPTQPAAMPIGTNGQPTTAGSTTQMTDLGVLASQWGRTYGDGDAGPVDTEGWSAGDLRDLLVSADLDLRLNSAFEDGADLVEVTVSAPGRGEHVISLLHPLDGSIVTMPIDVVDGEATVESTANFAGEPVDLGTTRLDGLLAGEDVVVPMCDDDVTVLQDGGYVLAKRDLDLDLVVNTCAGDPMPGAEIALELVSGPAGTALSATELIADEVGQGTVTLSTGEATGEAQMRITVTTGEHTSRVIEATVTVTEPLELHYRWRQVTHDVEAEGSTDWPGPYGSHPDLPVDSSVPPPGPDEDCTMHDRNLRESQPDQEWGTTCFDAVIVGSDVTIERAGRITETETTYRLDEGLLDSRVQVEAQVTYQSRYYDDPGDGSDFDPDNFVVVDCVAQGLLTTQVEADERTQYTDEPLFGVEFSRSSDGVQAVGLQAIGQDLAYHHEIVTEPIPSPTECGRAPSSIIPPEIAVARRFETVALEDDDPAAPEFHETHDGTAFVVGPEDDHAPLFTPDGDGWASYSWCRRADRSLDRTWGGEYLSGGRHEQPIDDTTGLHTAVFDMRQQWWYHDADDPDRRPSVLNRPAIQRSGGADVEYQFAAALVRPGEDAPELDLPTCASDNAAKFSVDDLGTSMVEGGEVKLKDRSSLPGGRITSWEWSAPGVTLHDIQNPRFTPPDDGDYDVTLTVRNADGQTATTTQTLSFTNRPPTVKADDLVVQPGHRAKLDLRLTDPGGVDAMTGLKLDLRSESLLPFQTTLQGGSYRLDLGMLDPGSHTVELTATDKDHARSRTTADILVLAEPGDGSSSSDGTGDGGTRSAGGEFARASRNRSPEVIVVPNASKGSDADSPDAPPSTADESDAKQSRAGATGDGADDGGSAAASSSPTARSFHGAGTADPVVVPAVVLDVAGPGAGSAVRVINASRIDGSPASLEIDLGDGRVHSLGPDGSVTTAWRGGGSYMLTGTAQRDAAAVGPRVATTVLVTGDPAPLLLSHTGATTAAQGERLPMPVTVTADAGGGPVADVRVDVVVDGVEVATASTGADGVATPVYRVDSAVGSHTVTLVARDPFADPDPHVDVVLDITANELPVADAGGPYALAFGDALVLDASGSTDADGLVAGVDWDLDGDGLFDDAHGVTPDPLPGAEVEAIVCGGTCSDAAAYPITARVADDRGATTDATSTVMFSSDFVVTMDPPGQTLTPNASVAFTVEVLSTSGFDEQVTLSVDGVPEGVSASFDRTIVAPDARALLTLTSGDEIEEGEHAIVVTGTAGTLVRDTSAPLDLEFGLTPTCNGAVDILVLDAETGDPIPGVYWGSFPGQRLANTDADGRIRRDDLPLFADNGSRRYDASFYEADHFREFRQIWVGCGTVTELIVHMEPAHFGDMAGTIVEGVPDRTDHTPARSVEATTTPISSARVTTSTPIGIGFGSTYSDSQFASADGTFSLRGIAAADETPHPNHVTVTANGYWPETFTMEAIRDTVLDNGSLPLVPRCTAPVVVRVVDRDSGEPVEGVEVDPGSGEEAVTGPDGRATVHVGLGHRNSSAEATLHLRLGRTETVGVDVVDCDVPTAVEAPFTPARPAVATFTGVAADAEDGTPLANVNVRLRIRVGSTFRSRTVRTDGEGIYLLEDYYIGDNITETDYTISADDLASHWGTDLVSLTARADDVAAHDLEMLRKKSVDVDGRMVDRVTEAPLEGVRVFGPDGLGDTTGPDGRYAFGVLLGRHNTPRHIALHTRDERLVGAPDDDPRYWGTSTPVVTAGEGETHTFDLPLLRECRGGAIRGTVVDATTGEPLRDILVQAFQQFGVTRGTYSDADGRFALAGLPVGRDNQLSRYTVRASGPGYNPATQTAHMYCGGSITVDFAPPTPEAGLAGLVTDPDGTPLAGVSMATGWGATATTDGAGRYSFDDAPLAEDGSARDWEVRAQPRLDTDLGGQTQLVTIEPGDNTADFTLARLEDGLPDLVVAVTDGVEEITGTATYEITVTNSGLVTAHEVLLTDEVAAQLDVGIISDGGSGAPAADGTVVTWPAFDLAPGATVTRSVDVQVAAGTPKGDDPVVNTATAESSPDLPDRDPADNTATDQSIIRVPNTAPVIEDLTGIAATEGGAASLTASVDDVDVADEQTLTVDWGDGSEPDVVTMDRAASTHSATLTHTWVEDGEFPITVTVDDGDGGTDAASTTAQVANVAPDVVLQSDGGVEGSPVPVDATVEDPGVEDTHELRWSCDEGVTFTGWEAIPEIRCTFDDDGSYPVLVEVRDDDGGTGARAAFVDVANVAPTVDLGGPYAGPWGAEITFSAAVDDPSAQDLTELSFDWDFDADGVLDAFTETPDITHVYAQPGEYVVEVHVWDDHDVTTATATVTVGQQALTLDAEPVVADVVPGAEVFLGELVAHAADASGAPAGGVVVDFHVGDDLVCSAVTDEAGTARCGDVAVSLSALLDLGYVARSAGDARFLPAESHGVVAVVAGSELPPNSTPMLEFAPPDRHVAAHSGSRER